MYKKRSSIIVLAFLVITLLCGCRVVMYEKDENHIVAKSKNKTITKININSTVHIESRSKLIVRGTTNLVPGSILAIKLKAYDDKATAEQVYLNNVEPIDKVVSSSRAEVNEDGMISAIVNRPNSLSRYRLELIFDPRLQSNEIQKKYGSSGELIRGGNGLEKIKDQDKDVHLIRMLVTLMNRNEPDGLFSTPPIK